jgi:hypothetical protein
MVHPRFPFVGAGEANYFEWAELFVCFDREPKGAEAAAIARRVPPPLRDTIEWSGPLLWVASEQGVGRLIKAAYKKQPTAPSRLTTNSRFAIAPGTAYARFNADIDAWLQSAHETVPILVAFRCEDFEAGGTQLSGWHHESVEALPRVLASLGRRHEPEIAKLALRLVEVAKRAKLALDDGDVARFERLVEAAREAEAEQTEKKWEALAAAANAALGQPAPPFAKVRDDLGAALPTLAKHLPATAKRLARLKQPTVRRGASDTAIAAAQKQLGRELSKAHRALLEAFDGGQIGEMVILGTARGGAVGDAELVTFSRAWSGPEADYVIVAHTGRDDVIALRGAKGEPIYVMNGTPGSGGGMITRQCKTLDIALDLAIKAGKVWNNLG